MEKVIVWGEERVYRQIAEVVHALVETGDAEVLAEFVKDGLPDEAVFYEPVWSEATSVLICARNYTDDLIASVVSHGVRRELLVPSDMLYKPGFSFTRYMALLKSRISILSNYCWGGLTYHYFHLPMLSPTINLFFTDGGYLHFLENLDSMLEKSPVFLRMDHDDYLGHDFPVFEVNDVKIFMNHSRNAEEGLDAWNRRKGRLNRENLLVMMATKEPESAERFCALPFSKKICFVTFETDLPHCMKVDPGKAPVSRYINDLAIGIRRRYDPWILLETGAIIETGESWEEEFFHPDTIEKRLGEAQKILIYGAWELGEKSFRIMKRTFGTDRLAGFAVTSMQGNPGQLHGLPVRPLSEWAEFLRQEQVPFSKVLTILGLNPRFYQEVHDDLQNLGLEKSMSLEELVWGEDMRR